MDVPDTSGFLLGEWRVERAYSDRRLGSTGRFEGTAVIVDGRYDESGNARFGQHTGPATRRLLIDGQRDRTLLFRFADGRPFVDLDLSHGCWSSVHDCRDDRYEIVTTVRSHDLIEEQWLVLGPDKEYDAVTTMTRMSAVRR